jgi:ActR/RegA family two-component response regulator
MNWKTFFRNQWVISIGGSAIVGLVGFLFASLRRYDLNPTNLIAASIGLIILGLIIFYISSRHNYTQLQPAFHQNAQIDADVDENDFLAEKARTRILFVDDDTEFPIIKILKGAGWENTRVVKDVQNLDDQKVRVADIPFVDVRGVGTRLFPNDEGLGLVLSLKKKYPQKRVVIYSANPEGDMTHEALRVADSFLPKNADPYEFINLIETFAKRAL